MRPGLKSIFATMPVVVLLCVLYDRRLVSYLTQEIKIRLKFETSKKIYSIDLSDEFERSKHLVKSFDVLEELKRDGYSPTYVSVPSMTRRGWNILISNRRNISEHKGIVTVIGVKSNHSVALLSQDSVARKNLESANESLWRSGNETHITKTNHSNTVNKSERGEKNQYDSLKKTNETKLVLKVPNVVHYVFLGSDLSFTFTNYLSYRSVDRFIKPDQIFVHGDHVPSGKWWNRTIVEVQNIYHIKRTYSNKAPNGELYKYPAHISDYMRTETLLSEYIDSTHTLFLEAEFEKDRIH